MRDRTHGGRIIDRDWRGYLNAEVDRAFYATFQITLRDLADWRGIRHAQTMGALINGRWNRGRRFGLGWRKP